MGLLKVSSFSYLSIAPFFSKSKLNSFLKQMDMAWNNWGDYKKTMLLDLLETWKSRDTCNFFHQKLIQVPTPNFTRWLQDESCNCCQPSNLHRPLLWAQAHYNCNQSSSIASAGGKLGNNHLSSISHSTKCSNNHEFHQQFFVWVPILTTM